MPAYQYVYVMKGLSKAWPGGKKVLDDVWLSFYPGAKIGVLGPNGAGKSTLLKIMAGLDTDWAGEAWVAEGATVGYLPQEPQLDPETDGRAKRAWRAWPKPKALLDRFEEVSNKLGEVDDPDEMQKLIDEQAALQEKIDAANAVGFKPHDRNRARCAALPAARCRCHQTFRRRTPPRGAVPPAAAKARSAAARRTDQPSGCGIRCMAADAISREYTGAVVMVTHDRYFLDNVTGWILELDRGKGIPYEGNYTSWLEQKQKRLEQESREETGRQKTLARELEWISAIAQSPAGQKQGAYHGL